MATKFQISLDLMKITIKKRKKIKYTLYIVKTNTKHPVTNILSV